MAKEICGTFIISAGAHEIITVRGSNWLEYGENFANTPDVVSATALGANADDINPLSPVLNTDQLTVKTEDGDVIVPTLEGIRIPINGQVAGQTYKILVECWTNGANPEARKFSEVVVVHVK